ncbi:MAG: DUF1622 domain-containing protein [Deltaproteobacteria bacterium]
MSLLENIRNWIEIVSLLIELLAVAIIVTAIAYASVRAALEGTNRETFNKAYDEYKVRLGRSLLLGLEILIAADVIRTVALEPTLTSVAVLGILIVIRTFLSWSLILEMEGRWPWQSKRRASPDPDREQ